VLVLYDASRRGSVSRLVSGMSDPRAQVLAYESLAEIDAFLEQHLGPA